MLVNTTKAKLAEGGVVLGCFVKYPDPALAELVALQGWDFVIADGEHGTFVPADIENFARAVELRGVTPLARVTTNQPHIILRFLDAGVHGIHVPWVNSGEEAEAAVQAVKYHPRGVRGLAGSRAADFGQTESLADYTARANAETLVVIHLETGEAIERIDDYLAVDGIDVLFLGPTDLSHSLGVPGQTDHPSVVAALEEATAAVLESDKALGVFVGNAEGAGRWRERGARYLATGIEGFVSRSMRRYLEEVRSWSTGERSNR